MSQETKKTGIDIQGSSWHPFNSQKVLCHSQRMEAIVAERYLPPVVLNLDVSGRCQYRCKHCHHRQKQVHDKCMPDLSERLARTLPYFLKTWKRNGMGVEACCIVGSQGDALLYQHLPKLLKDLHFAGIEVGLVSNGYGYTSSLIDYVVHYSKFIGFSIDAGTEASYQKIKVAPTGAWKKVLSNVEKIVSTINRNGLRNDVGWKILILPDSYKEIYTSCKLAKELGCRYVQIRPADLPHEERMKIDVGVVETQIIKAIEDLEQPGEFEIVGIRHKFSPTLEQVLPNYCYLTPLTVTVTSDGKAYACVDRRCDDSIMIADCGVNGWNNLEEIWGTSKHVELVHHIINNSGSGPTCGIRCSNFGYDKYFRNYFVQDNMDWKLI